MPIKIIHQNHFELVGTGNVLLTTANAVGPVEPFPGPVTEDVALSSRAYAVISKNDAQDNEHRAQAIQSLTERINTVVDEYGIKCVLEIRSKRDPGIEVQTEARSTRNEEISSLIHSFLSKNFSVVLNHEPLESQSEGLASFERKNQNGKVVFQSVRITIGSLELSMRRDKLVDQLAELVGLLNVRLGFNPAREPAVED